MVRQNPIDGLAEQLNLTITHTHTVLLRIYLRPRAITRELLHMLDPDGVVTAALMRNKAADLAKLEQEYEALSKTKAEIDARALHKGYRWTYGVMAAVTLQGLVMARLIWWDLSWDVMEPVAYLIGFT